MKGKGTILFLATIAALVWVGTSFASTSVSMKDMRSTDCTTACKAYADQQNRGGGNQKTTCVVETYEKDVKDSKGTVLHKKGDAKEPTKNGQCSCDCWREKKDGSSAADDFVNECLADATCEVLKETDTDYFLTVTDTPFYLFVDLFKEIPIDAADSSATGE